MTSPMYIARHDNKNGSYAFGYGYCPEDALENAFEKNGDKIRKLNTEEITGMRVAKGRFAGRPIKAHEASADVQRDIEAIKEDFPQEQWEEQLDKITAKLVFTDSQKKLMYDYEYQAKDREEEENMIECAEPIRRDTGENAFYRVDVASAIPSKTLGQTDKAIEMPIQSNVKAKETLEPPELQALVNKYHDKVSVKTLDIFVRAVKGERINESAPDNEDPNAFTENNPNFKAFIIEMQHLVDKELPKYQDSEDIINNLRKNFPLKPSPEIENESEREKKEGTPFQTRVTTAIPSICANYEMSCQASGALLLCNKRDNSPEIKADHKRIRTLKQNDRTIQDTVALAKERNWSSIKVSGLNRYRQAIWMEASLQQPPINVIGYKPTEQDQQHLASVLERQNQDYISGEKSTQDHTATPPACKYKNQDKRENRPGNRHITTNHNNNPNQHQVTANEAREPDNHPGNRKNHNAI